MLSVISSSGQKALPLFVQACMHFIKILRKAINANTRLADTVRRTEGPRGGRTDTGYLDKHIIFVFNMLVTITSGYQSAANNMTTLTHTHLHTVPAHTQRQTCAYTHLSFVAVFSLRSEYWNINFESIVQFPTAFLLFALFTRMCSTMRLLHSCLSIAMRNEYQLQLHFLHKSGSDKYSA